jgi:hypothetical protein
MATTKAPWCAVTATVEVIGGRWKPTILFHLKDGPRRFNELRRLVPGITQRMLTLQLRALERDGIVARTVHESVPPHVESPSPRKDGRWGRSWTPWRSGARATSRDGDCGRLPSLAENKPSLSFLPGAGRAIVGQQRGDTHG